jgi:hypothetical protein
MKQIAISAWLEALPAETQAYAKAIERTCRKDFDKLEAAGVDRAPLVMMLVYFAKRRAGGISEKTRRKDRYYRDTAKKLSGRMENLASEVRAFVGTPPYWNPTPESSIGRAILGMDFLAESMRKNSLDFGRNLRRNGRRKPDVATHVLGWILRDNEDFNCWEALSHLVVEALHAVGISEKETKHITGDMLRKAAERYRHLKPLWIEKENDT